MAATVSSKLSKLNLPAFQQDLPYQERIDKCKEELGIKGMPPGELGKMFKDFDTQLDELDEQAKAIRLKKAATEHELLVAMEDDDLQSFKLSDGTLLYLQMDSYASVENKEELMKFVAQENLEGLLSLPWASLNSLTKERLLAGEPLPGGVKVFIKTSVRKRKAFRLR